MGVNIGKKGRVSASTATLTLTVVFLVLFVALIGFVLLQSYRDASTRAQDRAEAAAHVVSAHVQWLMEASYQALRRIDDSVGNSLQMPMAGDVGDMNAAVRSLPGDVQAWLFDANGVPRLTNAGIDKRNNATNDEYFQAAKTGTEFTVSPLIVPQTGGDKVFTITKRLERNGAFVGVAVLVMPAAVLDDFKSSLELGTYSTVTLVRLDGNVVTRLPVPDTPLDVSKGPLFSTYLPKAKIGTYSTVSTIDGIARIVSYRPVDGYPLIVTASIAVSEAFVGFWQLTATTLAVGIPCMLGLLGMSIWIARLLRRDDRTRDQLSQALEDNRTLFREIHHRVKNNLQQVSSLVQLQPLPTEAKLELARRISAMAAVHEHIYRSDQFDRVDIADYLPGLMEDLKQSYGTDLEIEWNVTAIDVNRDNALPLALIANEVISNAMKHGFKDGRKGKVMLLLERHDASQGRMVIRDNGAGFDPATPSKGMGSRLIKALTAQVGGTGEFHMDSGTVFTLVFPILADEIEAA